MAHREKRSEFAPNAVNHVPPVSSAVDVTPTNGIDLQGKDSLLWLVAIGIEGITLDGSNYIDAIFEHSDAVSSGFATCAAGDLVGGAELGADLAGAIRFNAIAEAPALHLVGYVGAKRYARCRLDYVGTHGAGTPVAVIGLPGHAERLSY